MTELSPGGADAAPFTPTADLPRATIGMLLDSEFAARLEQATANVAHLRTIGEIDAGDMCDILVVDPRHLTPTAPEVRVVRRHVEAHVPCVYYTASNPHAIRSVVASSYMMPVRLVLFDIDDDPETFQEVIGLAPRHAHMNQLRSAVQDTLRLLPAPASTTLDTVLRRPEQFFDASDVALRAGLSRRHLDRLLTAADLAPTKNWVVGARAWHAAYLLVCGRFSAEATAARLGYADSKALRRHLAAVWRTSPTQLSCADLDSLLHEMVAFLRTREPSIEEISVVRAD